MYKKLQILHIFFIKTTDNVFSSEDKTYVYKNIDLIERNIEKPNENKNIKNHQNSISIPLFNPENDFNTKKTFIKKIKKIKKKNMKEEEKEEKKIYPNELKKKRFIRKTN